MRADARRSAVYQLLRAFYLGRAIGRRPLLNAEHRPGTPARYAVANAQGSCLEDSPREGAAAMAVPPTQIDDIAEQCVVMYRNQRREEAEWNEPPPVLADIIYAQSQLHQVDQRLLTERVRAKFRRAVGDAKGPEQSGT